ncbi:aromatic ring-opening dioxygenase LigA [Sediminihabitans luteus]|nr:aromatic ring-opening dioxygenase LigA [Sediminihabitans luteus]
MSTTQSTKKFVRWTGIISIVAAVVMILAGAVTWATVSSQLSEQQITVSEDADFLAGDEVDGPFSAYAQAEIIDHHALEATGGLTYAQLDQDDPARATAMNASFLRASLFTSVVAYGVSALVIGLGVLFGVVGVAFTKLGSSKGETPALDARTHERIPENV